MGVRLTVRVRFPDGGPVHGAEIVGTNHDAWSARHRRWAGTSDASGNFTWENLDKGTRGDRYTFSVSHTDSAGVPWRGEVSERIRGERELLIVVRPLGQPSVHQPAHRRLAAVMFTDIVGFTKVAQLDEDRALGLLRLQREILRPLFARHHGTEIKTIGDGFLVEFESTLEASECAIDIQDALAQHNRSANDPSRRIQLRIGLHVGDVVHVDGDILGDAVNIASRICPLAEPGGICISEDVYVQVRSRLQFPFVAVDVKSMKATVFPVKVFKIVLRPESNRILSSPTPGDSDFRP